LFKQKTFRINSKIASMMKISTRFFYNKEAVVLAPILIMTSLAGGFFTDILKNQAETIDVKVSWNEIIRKVSPTEFVSPYAEWKYGPLKDPEFFPLCVWLQDPENAEKYQTLGINTYIGLWDGPTEEQLERLRKAGMHVICFQNEVGLSHSEDPIIIGWMHNDEPDNAQPLPSGKGYGPPILPQQIVDDYMKIKTADPSRPILLNLGQGVAWDNWYGRGVRKNKPEDYPEYIKGCDIVSFDIYPVVHTDLEVAGKLWYVAKGVKRLCEWAEGQRIVWNCIECTRISNPNKKPTPRQVKAEVWMSLIHGSTGIIYFVHQFKPEFIEAGLLADSEMAQAVKEINRQILELAPVLNSPTLYAQNAVNVSGEEDLLSPLALMIKERGGKIYIFAVNVQEKAVEMKFTAEGMSSDYVMEVYDEDRLIVPNASIFEDYFDAFDVHIYSITRGEDAYKDFKSAVGNETSAAEAAGYLSSDAKFLVRQAREKYDFAVELSEQGRWQDACLQLQSALNLIQRAQAAESSFRETMAKASIAATAISLVGAIVIVLKRRGMRALKAFTLTVSSWCIL